MNGRVYDPVTAMFFSPDPFIQSGGNWRNYNRYSYCMNNPLIYTDPSGYRYKTADEMEHDEISQSYMEPLRNEGYHSFGFGGGGGNGPIGWSTAGSNSGMVDITNNLINSPFGGTWTNGNYSFYRSQIDAYEKNLTSDIIEKKLRDFYGNMNRQLNNISNDAKALVANIVSKTDNEWNNLLNSFCNDIWSAFMVSESEYPLAPATYDLEGFLDAATQSTSFVGSYIEYNASGNKLSRFELNIVKMGKAIDKFSIIVDGVGLINNQSDNNIIDLGLDVVGYKSLPAWWVATYVTTYGPIGAEEINNSAYRNHDEQY